MCEYPTLTRELESAIDIYTDSEAAGELRKELDRIFSVLSFEDNIRRWIDRDKYSNFLEINHAKEG